MCAPFWLVEYKCHATPVNRPPPILPGPGAATDNQGAGVRSALAGRTRTGAACATGRASVCVKERDQVEMKKGYTHAPRHTHTHTMAAVVSRPFFWPARRPCDTCVDMPKKPEYLGALITIKSRFVYYIYKKQQSIAAAA
jgi:hypothetical protein